MIPVIITCVCDIWLIWIWLTIMIPIRVTPNDMFFSLKLHSMMTVLMAIIFCMVLPIFWTARTRGCPCSCRGRWRPRRRPPGRREPRWGWWWCCFWWWWWEHDDYEDGGAGGLSCTCSEILRHVENNHNYNTDDHQSLLLRWLLRRGNKRQAEPWGGFSFCPRPSFTLWVAQ